jgi:hypothetical protein
VNLNDNKNIRLQFGLLDSDVGAHRVSRVVFGAIND